jgi:hypothetical protein
MGAGAGVIAGGTHFRGAKGDYGHWRLGVGLRVTLGFKASDG